ncbi:hypothetical protein HMPREF0578_1295 [Mobiluncus mulieris 28-1]|nr:hypothetical protein HMPREF0578_1295 [Mobiluncus mulieris 28-1]
MLTIIITFAVIVIALALLAARTPHPGGAGATGTGRDATGERTIGCGCLLEYPGAETGERVQ